MDDLKQLCECYVVKSPLSIGVWASIGIEVLEFGPVLVLVLVLVLKISFQELVLVLILGPSRVLVLVWPNWYCLCLMLTACEVKLKIGF